MYDKTPQSVKAAKKRAYDAWSKAVIEATKCGHILTGDEILDIVIPAALQSLDEKGGIVMPESEYFPNEVWLANGRANLHQVKTRSKLSMMKYYRADYTPPATRAPDTVGDGWQPIETAPKDGTHILVFNPDRQEPEVAWWSEHAPKYKWTTWDNGYLEGWAEYWQPLPAQPTARLQLQRQGD